jgi:hypothetical protein
MGLFLVTEVANGWAVVNDGIILDLKETSFDAIQAAVSKATNSAVNGRETQVLLDEGDEEPRLIWDSTKQL